MNVWRLKQETCGKYLPISDGSVPNYGGFEYRVRPVNGDGIKIIAACAEAELWLSAIEAGISDYFQILQEKGEILSGVQIEITKIYAHDLDTNELIMKNRGFSFMHELMTKIADE